MRSVHALRAGHRKPANRLNARPKGEYMSCETGVRWLYKLEANFSWESKHPIPQDLVFRDSGGKVRLIVDAAGKITVTRGYAWNGCSPKFCVFDLMLGTPEGVVHHQTGRPKTYYASMVHDALYQFMSDGLPLKRRHADDFFRRLLEEADFSPAWLYWLAVRAFGWVVRRGTAMKRKWHGTRQRVDELLVDKSEAPGAI